MIDREIGTAGAFSLAVVEAQFTQQATTASPSAMKRQESAAILE